MNLVFIFIFIVRSSFSFSTFFGPANQQSIPMLKSTVSASSPYYKQSSYICMFDNSSYNEIISSCACIKANFTCHKMLQQSALTVIQNLTAPFQSCNLTSNISALYWERDTNNQKVIVEDTIFLSNMSVCNFTTNTFLPGVHLIYSLNESQYAFRISAYTMLTLLLPSLPFATKNGVSCNLSPTSLCQYEYCRLATISTNHNIQEHPITPWLMMGKTELCGIPFLAVDCYANNGRCDAVSDTVYASNEEYLTIQALEPNVITIDSEFTYYHSPYLYMPQYNQVFFFFDGTCVHNGNVSPWYPFLLLVSGLFVLFCFLCMCYVPLYRQKKTNYILIIPKISDHYGEIFLQNCLLLGEIPKAYFGVSLFHTTTETSNKIFNFLGKVALTIFEVALNLLLPIFSIVSVTLTSPQCVECSYMLWGFSLALLIIRGVELVVYIFLVRFPMIQDGYLLCAQDIPGFVQRYDAIMQMQATSDAIGKFWLGESERSIRATIARPFYNLTLGAFIVIYRIGFSVSLCFWFMGFYCLMGCFFLYLIFHFIYWVISYLLPVPLRTALLVFYFDHPPSFADIPTTCLQKQLENVRYNMEQMKAISLLVIHSSMVIVLISFTIIKGCYELQAFYDLLANYCFSWLSILIVIFFRILQHYQPSATATTTATTGDEEEKKSEVAVAAVSSSVPAPAVVPSPVKPPRRARPLPAVPPQQAPLSNTSTKNNSYELITSTDVVTMGSVTLSL